jgi:tRNA threonylcarbamoyladenosine biosynthesis protein TsaB
MLLLAIDTSQDAGSVSLAESADEKLKILETASVEGGTFSAQLVPRIAAMLQKHGRTPESLDVICAATGPGSFTGLRIGLAAVKGLAEVLGKPIVAVSMLEVLARSAARAASRVVSAMDARRGEFYLGEYQRENGELRCVREWLAATAELMAVSEGAQVVTADRRIGEMTGANLVPAPSSADVARVGHRKFIRRQITSVDELDANYLRRDENLFFTK